MCFLSSLSCVKKRDLSENVVVAHMSSNPSGLHITNDLSGFRAIIFDFLHRPLVRIDIRSQKLSPLLVEALPEISDDGTIYTYRLRNDVKWDDGSSLSVDDVIFSIKLVISPLTANPQLKGNFISVIKNVTKVPTDSLKFSIHTFSASRANTEILTEVYLLQKKVWDKNKLYDQLSFENLYDSQFKPSAELQKWSEEFNAPEMSKNLDKIVGLGPYRLTEWVDDNYLILEKKKNWWGDADTSMMLANEPDKIIFRIIKDETSTYYAMRNENIDAITRLGLTKLIKLQQHDYFNEKYKSGFINQYAYNWIGLNMKPDGINHKPFFTDRRVRRAMAHLVAIDDIIKVMYKGKATRQNSFISPLKKEYNKDLPDIEFSPEKAKLLLDEAGWKDTDGDNIRDKMIGGEKIKFSFKMNYMSEAPPSKEICLMIKDEMNKVGIEMIPNPIEFSTFWEKAYTHDFDALMGAWLGSALYEDPTQLWHTSQWANFGANFCGFGNAATDSLIYAVNTELNDSLYEIKVKELQRVIYEEQPYIFVSSPQSRVAIHKRFIADFYSEKPQMYINAFILRSGTSVLPDIVQ